MSIEDYKVILKQRYDTDHQFRERVDEERKRYKDISNALIKIEELENRIEYLEKLLVI